jgi:gliding motility-associated-like protein
MKYFYRIKFFNYLIVLCGLFFSGLIVNAQVLNPGIYDWEGFTAGEVHAISTNAAPATWEIGNGFTAIATGNGNGSQMRVLIANSLATNALRYDGLAGAVLNSAILKSTSGVDFGIKQFNIWPTQNETQMIEVYVKRDGVTIDTIRAYYQPTTPIHKITISSSDYPFLANMDELEIFDFNVGVVLDDIEVMLNQAPIAAGDEVTVTEDTPTTGNVLTNDNDPEGNALTASLVTAPVNGTVVLNADGSFTYTPNSNYNGPDSLIYQVCDDGSPSLCDTAWVHFSIEAINDHPTFTGLPASITIDEDEYLAYLRNALSDGTFADVDAGSNDISLTLQVNMGVILFAANGGIPVTLSGSGSPTVTITGTAAAIESYININSNIVYLPEKNATDPVTVSLSANDNGHTGTGGGGDVALGSFIININAINDAPEAVDDEVDVQGGAPANGNVLDNDTDVEGNALTASLVTAPVNGTVILNANGSFTYTPNSNYNGLDSLIYQVCDNGTPSLCDTAKLRFTITADNGTPLPNCGLAVTQSSGTTGLACLGCTVTDAPKAVDMYSSTYSQLRVSIGLLGGVYQALGFSAPAAAQDTLRIGISTTVSLTDASLLAGLTFTLFHGNTQIAQYNNDNTTFELRPAEGSNPAELVFAPGAAFDSLRIEFNALLAQVSIVHVHYAQAVPPDPVLENPVVSVTKGQSATFSIDRPLAGYSYGWFAEVAGGTALGSGTSFTTEALSADTTYYVETVNANGCISSQRIAAQASILSNQPPDVTTSSDTVTFTEPVEGNPIPVAVDPGLTVTDLDNATLALATISITGNFQSDEDVLSFTNNGTSMGNITASYNTLTGVLVLTSEGATATLAQWQTALRSVTYNNTSENPNTAMRTISFRANDATNDSNQATKMVAVVAANTYPIAVDDEITLSENVPATGNVLTNDSDPEGDALTASLVTAPVNGTVVLNADGSVTYTPNSNYNGLDSLVYQVCDNGEPSLCDTATVRLTVIAGNPKITNVNASTADGLYKIGDQINVTISFDQAVTVDITGGIPTLKLQTGELSRDAAYTSGSGSNTLTFVYVVQAGDSTPDLDYVSTAALVLNGANIRNTAGLDATLTLPQVGGSNSLAGQRNIIVDGVAPVSTTVILPANGYYRARDVLRFGVKFDENVTVNTSAFTPSLTVVIGDITVHASYVSGSGTDEIFFSYTVAPGENDLDGIGLQGTIRNNVAITDAAGNEALATLNNIPSTVGILVNTMQPSVALSTGAISPVSAPFTVTAIFSEAVTGFTLGDIIASNATLSSLQTSDNISYSFLVMPTVGGMVQVSIPADVAANIGNNGNSASNTLSIQYTTTITGVTLEDGSFVYDGTAKSLIIAGTLPEGTSVSYENNSRINVGTQEVTATISGGNYETLVLKANLTVTKAVITGVTLEDGSFVYDGTAKSLTIVGTLPAGTTVSYENNSRTEVGTQEVTATISGGNYETLVLTANLTITRAVIMGVTLEDKSFVYDGTAKSLTIVGTLPAGTTVSYENNSRTEVGTQEVTATISGGNYETLVLTANLTITRAVITGVTLEDKSFVYDGTAKSLAIAGTLPTGTTVSYENNSRTDVGTQEVTATISGGNYETLVLKANLTVTKAVFTGVTLKDGSFVYDGTAKSLAIAGTLPIGTTVSYENNGRTDVGTQEVTATISGANYTDLVLTANLTVTKAVITGVTFVDGSFVYDGTAKSLAIAGTLPTGTAVSYENNSRTDVGTQEVTATISGGNYETLVLKANLTVTKAVITGVTFVDGSFVYDGTAKSLAIAGTLPTGTTVSYENNSRTEVGTQEVTATISGGNYETLVLKANSTVTKAVIRSITLEDGSFVYDGTAKSLTIAGTLPAGTSVSYENNSRTDVGAQEVTATISGANYNDLVLTANLTITKASIDDISDITFVDGSFVYDGTAKSLAIAGTLPAGTTVSYENNSRINVGTQKVTAIISGSNYTDLVLIANLTITRATITDVTLEDRSFVYDGTAKSLTIAGTLPTGATISYENNSRTDVGTQEVTATISGGNYETLVLKANLTVTKAVIRSVTLEDGSFVYDGTAKSLTIAGTLPAGTSASYENNSRINVGNQEVTATISGANYTDLVLIANLTITKASIDDVSDITFVDGSFVYDGTANSLAIAGTLPAGTTVSYENNSRINVGTQKVTAIISGSNYTDLVLTANLTITKAAIVGITLDDGSFVYDGTAKSLTIAGTLPEGTTVSYKNNNRTDVGAQEVTATISGANYNDLVLTANLTITKASIDDVSDITFVDGSFVYDGTAKSLTIAGTLPAGTSVSYENNSRTEVGAQEVTATISGANYTDLVLIANLTITKASIDDVSDITFVDGSFVYDGTAKSLTIVGTLPAGTNVSYENNSRTDVGTQEVTATISGNNYTQLILKATLHIRPVERRIDFEELSEKTYGDSDFDLRATANSGEAISYSSSNTAVATVSTDGRIHIVAAGETIITATVPENTNYNNKPIVSRKLIVGKASQQISFPELGEIARDAGSILLTVSASSSLPVRLEVSDPQVATVSGTTLNVLRLGTVLITAYQEGDSNYEAANPVHITVRVADQAANLPIKVHKALSPNGDGINDFLMIEGVKDYPDNRLIIADRNGMEIIEIKGYNNEDKVFRGLGPGNNPIPPGTYFYLLEVKVNESWKYEKGYFIVRY